MTNLNLVDSANTNSNFGSLASKDGINFKAVLSGETSTGVGTGVDTTKNGATNRSSTQNTQVATQNAQNTEVVTAATSTRAAQVAQVATQTAQNTEVVTAATSTQTAQNAQVATQNTQAVATTINQPSTQNAQTVTSANQPSANIIKNTAEYHQQDNSQNAQYIVPLVIAADVAITTMFKAVVAFGATYFMFTGNSKSSSASSNAMIGDAVYSTFNADGKNANTSSNLQKAQFNERALNDLCGTGIVGASCGGNNAEKSVVQRESGLASTQFPLDSGLEFPTNTANDKPVEQKKTEAIGGGFNTGVQPETQISEHFPLYDGLTSPLANGIPTLQRSFTEWVVFAKTAEEAELYGSPYVNLKDGKSVGIGKDFTKSQKEKMLEENKLRNGGVVRSDDPEDYFDILKKPQKSQSGVKPDASEWQFDHIIPKSKGGTNSFGNCRIISRKLNREKCDK